MQFSERALNVYGSLLAANGPRACAHADEFYRKFNSGIMASILAWPSSYPSARSLLPPFSRALRLSCSSPETSVVTCMSTLHTLRDSLVSFTYSARVRDIVLRESEIISIYFDVYAVVCSERLRLSGKRLLFVTLLLQLAVKQLAVRIHNKTKTGFVFSYVLKV